MRSVLITGVQAVGKSTVSAQAAQILGVPCWDYADLMLQVDPGLGGKDDIRRLDVETRTAIYRKVDVLLEDLFKPSRDPAAYVLLENHLSIVDPVGIHTFPHEDIRRYSPVGLAIIEGDPDAIVSRRQRDRRRDRHIGTSDEVRKQQAINRGEADQISHLFGFSTVVVRNDDDLTRAIHALVAFVQESSR